MDKKSNARENYRAAVETSQAVDENIDRFLANHGSQYPVEVESEETPKGSALFYLGKDMKDTRKIEFDLQQEVIGQKKW